MQISPFLATPKAPKIGPQAAPRLAMRQLALSSKILD
jgi:hypothetical protein